MKYSNNFISVHVTTTRRLHLLPPSSVFLHFSLNFDKFRPLHLYLLQFPLFVSFMLSMYHSFWPLKLFLFSPNSEFLCFFFTWNVKERNKRRLCRQPPEATCFLFQKDKAKRMRFMLCSNSKFQCTGKLPCLLPLIVDFKSDKDLRTHIIMMQ